MWKPFSVFFASYFACMLAFNIYTASYLWVGFDVVMLCLYSHIIFREFFPTKEKAFRSKMKAKYWQMYYTYYTPKNQNEKLKMFARLNGFKHKTYTSGDGTKITQCILH